ncbi:hypothetical protein [Streptomyces heilongjiangensis]|uniref:Uncharacterized protein n=1 Tax=Streptomyces heilongjiangensis TaxID=945052 RepID=A0ABW1BKD1_9ACTN|nr:hypothetical protein [Streptomyces heilongjiangensis]MDC2952237.1 hypothetical protein [Streptomyces heilongjiangensis]
MTTRVEISAPQLPEPLRPLLEAYKAAQREAADAHNRLRVAAIPQKHALQAPADEASRKAGEAHVALLEATRERPLEMRQYSHAQFAAAVERAREHLAAAERELRAAAGHAAVHGSVRDGKPCVNTERGGSAAGLTAAMFAVGLVQEAAGALPDAIDS